VLKAFEDLYKQYNMVFERETWYKCIGGVRSYDPYEALLTKYPKLTKAKLEEEYEKNYQMNSEGQPPREGVVNYLKRAKELNLKIGVASSSSRNWIETNLKRLQINDYFDYKCSSDDVEQVKPYPDLYLKVLKHFGISPHEAIVFEDSANGSMAAINAGIPCVAVPNEVTKALTFDERIAFKINSMAELTLDQVIEKVKQ